MSETPENQQQYGSILTILGENAEQNGKLQNKQITFTHIAIGDANDSYVQPDRQQAALTNELARIPVNSVDVLQPTPESVPMLKVEAVLPDDVNDLVIREFAAVATFDGNTYFHAVGNCARIYVPAPVNNGNVSTPVTLEMIFVITSAEPIVEIDPNVVTASRDYVNETSDTAVSQANGINIFPANAKKNVEVGSYVPEGTDAIRYENGVWLLGKDKYGTITAIDTLNRTVTMIVVPENVEAVVSISKRRQFSRTLDFKIPSDFPDLQTAADELSAYQGNNKSRLRLIIEKDHKLTKGMGVFNGDFSNIEILSEDPIVYLDDNFVGVTEAVQGNVNGEVPRPPLIYGFNASMPELNAVIDMKNKHGSGYFGVNCTGFVHPDQGVINAGFRGVQWRSGFFFGVSTNFSGATGCGARVQKSGTMNVGGANLDYCCKTEDLQLAALYVSRGSICEFRYGTARYSGGMAILGRRSIISAANTDLSFPKGYAVSAESVAHIDVINAVCDSPATGVVYSRFGSTVTAGSLKITNPKENLLKYMYRVSDGGSITVNGGNTVDGQPITAQHIYDTTPNFNIPYGDGIIYHVDYQGVIESGVNSDGYWVKYADGRQVTLSGVKTVDTGDVLVGEFSGKIALPAIPLPFVLVNHISVEVVGRTDVSGGGNRVFVHKCYGFYPEGDELRIQNTGVALDVEATDYTVKSVSLYVRVEGRWR